MNEQLFNQKAGQIKFFLTDVDGVMTDSSLSFFTDEAGKTHEIKHFESLDGMGLMFLKYCGIRTGIISRGNSPTLEFWANILNMDVLYYNVADKQRALNDLQTVYHITPQETAFVGDDIIDLGVLKRVGLPLSVLNGVEETKQSALYVTQKHGGHGAVREIAEKILKARGQWQQVVQDVENGVFKLPPPQLRIVRGL